MGLNILILCLYSLIIVIFVIEDIIDRWRRDMKIDIRFLKEWVHSACTGAVFVVLICIIIDCLLLTISYTNYLDDRAAFDGVIAQHKQAVSLYKDSVVLNMDSALTDFKAQGYAIATSEFITALRNRIIKYNASIIKKRSLKSTFMFGALIIAPDPDMKIINIVSNNKK